MAKAKGTEKQQDIKRRLLADEPVSEIARAHDTTAQAIYSQISRMRQIGMLPKKRRGQRMVAAASPNGKPATEAKTAGSNGQPKVTPLTLEDHLTRELDGVEARLVEITAQVDSLVDEGRTLEARKAKLKGAEEALRQAEPKQTAQAEPKTETAAAPA